MSCFTCFQLRPGCIIRAAAQVDDELSTLLSLDEDTVGAQNMVATGGPKQRRRSHHGWSNCEFGAMTIACRGIRLTQMKLEDWKQSLLRDHDQETVTWSYVSSLGSTAFFMQPCDLLVWVALLLGRGAWTQEPSCTRQCITQASAMTWFDLKCELHLDGWMEGCNK